MIRSVSRIVLYALLAAGVTLTATYEVLPTAFWLVTLLTPLPLLAAALSYSQRLAIYTITAVCVGAVTLLLPAALLTVLAIVATIAAVFFSEWITVRNKRIAQTNTEQIDRLFHALAQATSHLVNASDFSTGINQALDALGDAGCVDRIYIFQND